MLVHPLQCRREGGNTCVCVLRHAATDKHNNTHGGKGCTIIVAACNSTKLKQHDGNVTAVTG